MQHIEILKKYNFWANEPISFGYARPSYLDKLTQYLNNALVKVILGQRRVGKSYLLRMLIHYLMTQHKVPAKNILYINKDLAEFDFINDTPSLLDAIALYKKTLKPKGKVYLFLDEIQEIKGWEKAVNSLSQNYKEEFEIFITGSNANLLANELSSYLSGRYVNFEIFPFSYTEYLDYHKMTRDKKSLLSYLEIGGIPAMYHLHDAEMKLNYITALKDSIVLRDIVNRYQIRDVHLLKNLIDFITDSMGSLFSVKSVVDMLNSNGIKSSHETIGNYLGYLESAYFLHECARYDIKGKQILAAERKYYLNDLAFKYYLTSSFGMGMNRFLENCVYINLLRKGYSVYVGKLLNKEIDFIAEKEGSRIYIQVAYLLSDESVINREFGNLEKIPDSYPKYVVTLDDINFGQRNGIIHTQAWEFLD